MDKVRGPWHRRKFLKTVAAAGGCYAITPVVRSAGEPIKLNSEHLEAVNRRRRITIQYDANNALGKDWKRWLEYRFSRIDEPDVQIDSIWWDIQPLLKGYFPTPPKSLIYEWPTPDTDIVEELIDETRKRKLEVFWTHRISEVDIKPPNSEGGWRKEPHPFKQSHPDWTIETWWPHGLWNLANAEVREYKVGLIRHLAETYELDGFQLDFARHIPCLPPGQQWELRHHVTDFVRQVRETLLKVAEKKGNPILLAVRIPRSLEGCRIDGFDIESWAKQNLVDIYTLGSRSIEVDIEGFRELIGNRPVKLQPCLDDHHAPDGYRCPPIEVFRGTFARWWSQGADSVMTFNWASADSELCEEMGGEVATQSQLEAYREVGEPSSLAGKDRVFVVERRGGYPWADGYFNQNNDSPLPKPLSTGQWVEIPLRIAKPDKAAKIVLTVVVSGALEADQFELRLNGTDLKRFVQDDTWKDPQISYPEETPASGRKLERYKIDPAQRLMRLECDIASEFELADKNEVEVKLKSESPEAISIEKVELSVQF